MPGRAGCGREPGHADRLRGAGAALGGLAGATLLGAHPAAAQGARPRRVLVYSHTTGYRHHSIRVGIHTIQQLGAEHGFAVEASEDPGIFTDSALRRFGAVVFLNTTGAVMTTAGRGALRRFVLAGGGWVGVHSAADTEYEWPFYERLLAGGYFLCHPIQQPGVLDREDERHPSTRHLPERWPLALEEFYSFRTNPRERSRVLLSIKESTYQQDLNTSHLPSEGYPDPDYRRHLAGGILSALR